MATLFRPWWHLLLLVLAMLVASTALAQRLGKPITPILSWSNGGLSWTQPPNGIAVGGHNIFNADNGDYLTTVRDEDGRWEPTSIKDKKVERFYINAFDTGAGNTSTYSDDSNVVSKGQPSTPILSWSNGGLSWTQPPNGITVGGHNIFNANGDYLTTVRVDNGRWEPRSEDAHVERFYIVAFDTGAGSSSKYSDESNTVSRYPDPFAGLPFFKGTVVAYDYAEDPEPINVWNYVTNGFHTGEGPYDSASDTQIVHRESGGDSLRGLDGRFHNAYRRLHTAGPQSLWDAVNDEDKDDKHTRSQLGGWGEYNTIHVSRPTKREFIVYSVRLDPETRIRGSVCDHTGLYYLSMISQFKSKGGANGPVLSVYEGIDGIQLVAQERDRKHYIGIRNVPRGVWLRIGVDILWSNGDDGAYQWWGDLDGDGIRDFEPLSERRMVSTLEPGPNASAMMNIGPYHVYNIDNIDLNNRNGRDYSNIEFFDHSAGDDWGNLRSPLENHCWPSP